MSTHTNRTQYSVTFIMLPLLWTDTPGSQPFIFFLFIDPLSISFWRTLIIWCLKTIYENIFKIPILFFTFYIVQSTQAKLIVKDKTRPFCGKTLNAKWFQGRLKYHFGCLTTFLRETHPQNFIWTRVENQWFRSTDQVRVKHRRRTNKKMSMTGHKPNKSQDWLTKIHKDICGF